MSSGVLVRGIQGVAVTTGAVPSGWWPSEGCQSVSAAGGSSSDRVGLEASPAQQSWKRESVLRSSSEWLQTSREARSRKASKANPALYRRTGCPSRSDAWCPLPATEAKCSVPKMEMLLVLSSGTCFETTDEKAAWTA